MNNQKLDKTLKKLKQLYDQKPDQSSPEEIMSYIKKQDERKRQLPKKLQGLGFAASIVAVIGIGSILLLSETNDQAGPEVGYEESREEAMFGVDHRELNELAINREMEITDVLEIEGMEEEINLKLWIDEELGISTYIDERFEVDSVFDINGYTAQVYANYTGDRVEPAFFSVYLAPTNRQVSKGDYIEKLREEYTKNGYQETSDEYKTTWNSDESFLFINSTSGTTVAIHIFEKNGQIYEIKETYFGEFSEGFGARIQLMQKYFQWH